MDRQGTQFVGCLDINKDARNWLVGIWIINRKDWIHTSLLGIGVLVGFIIAYILIVSPILKLASRGDVVDPSRFDHLRGNLPNLISNVFGHALITAGFEVGFLWRGYLRMGE